MRILSQRAPEPPQSAIAGSYGTLHLVMGLRVKVIRYNSIDVVHINFSHALPEDLDGVIAEAIPYVRSRPANSVYTLTEATGVAISKLSNRKLQEFMEGNRPYVKAAAIFGLTSLGLAVLATLKLITGRAINAFATKDEALRWLESQQLDHRPRSSSRPPVPPSPRTSR